MWLGLGPPRGSPHSLQRARGPGDHRHAGTCRHAANTHSGGFVTRDCSSRKSSRLRAGTEFHGNPFKVAHLPFGWVAHSEPISKSSWGSRGGVYKMPRTPRSGRRRSHRLLQAFLYKTVPSTLQEPFAVGAVTTLDLQTGRLRQGGLAPSPCAQPRHSTPCLGGCAVGGQLPDPPAECGKLIKVGEHRGLHGLAGAL